MLTIRAARNAGEPREPVGKLCSATTHNFVSHYVASRMHVDEHAGPLSLKFAFRGQEVYQVGRARLPVDSSCYLLLNSGQRYASAVEQDIPTESLCIWLRAGFVEQVFHTLDSSASDLLDSPMFAPGEPLTFFDRLYRHDELITPIADRLRRAVTTAPVSDEWLEEQFHHIAERLLEAHRGVYREVERLPAARFATRVELYQRLHRAKDFLDAGTGTPVTLVDAADVAAMSPHHFLRSFKQAFRETPGRYQARRRMEKARDLLAGTDLPVTQICVDLGFDSLGTFSWAFRQRFGASPTAFRLAAGSRAVGPAEIGNPREAQDGAMQ